MDMSDVAVVWKRSSRCGDSVACVVVARAGDHMLIRDSNDPDGPVLDVSCAAWSGFITRIRHGSDPELCRKPVVG